MLIRGVGDMLMTSTLPDRTHPGLNRLARLLGEADLAVGNLECPLVGTGVPISKVDIARSDPEAGDILSFLGLHAVTLANNHIMDYGINGLDSTLHELKRRKIACAGAGHGQKSAFAPTFVGKTALVAGHLYFKREWPHYTDPFKSSPHQPGVAVVQGYEVEVPDGAGRRTVIAPESGNLELLAASVAHASRRAEQVVVLLHSHWGPLDVRQVDEGRRLATRVLVEAGADLILGHGPHVFNGVEFHQGKPIVHSLGNFFFCIPGLAGELYPDIRPFLSTMVKEDRFWLGLMAEYRMGEKLRFLPLELERTGTCEGLPSPAGKEATARILELLQQQCAPLGTRARLVKDRIEVSPL